MTAVLLTGVLLSLPHASAASAQSLTVGSLSGIVRDPDGTPVREASVRVRSAAVGTSRIVATDREGRFAFQVLPPGEYELLAEQIGYRPRLVRGIAVRPARDVVVGVTLEPSPPPVAGVDTTTFLGSALVHSRAGVSQWLDRWAFTRLPGEEREPTHLGRLATWSGPDLESEGLPPSASGFQIDGIAYDAARHPALGNAAQAGALFPLGSLAAAELSAGGLDVERTGAAGVILTGYTRRGTRDLELHAFGDYWSDALVSSRHFDLSPVSASTWRGGVVVTGPVIRDTAHFAVGFEARRLQTPFPSAWQLASTTAPLLGVARDSFGVSLDRYAAPLVSESEVASGFGRFDWQIADQHTLAVRAAVASLSATSPDLGPGRLPSLGAALDGTDVAAGVILTSALTSGLLQEIHLAVETGTRDVRDSAPAGTMLVDGIHFGNDPSLPGAFRHTTVRLSETLYFSLGSHRLKLGVAGTFGSADDRYAHGRRGEFVFGSVDDFARTEGVFEQRTGPEPRAKYARWRIGGYVQDTWRPAPSLDVTLGLRVDTERLPSDEVRPDDVWLAQTGLSNRGIDDNLVTWSPRLGFSWDVANAGRWLLWGEAGIYQGAVSHAVLSELVTEAGQGQVRRVVGALGSWPEAAAATPAVATRLTLLGPDFQAPRSARVALGVSRAFGATGVVSVGGTYRHTDFLPRRHDLNLPVAPTGTDQYGRPLYGILTQQGALLAALPGSNRRFAGFDVVSAIDPDGFSDYRGLTVSAERQLSGQLRFLAGYTYSRTTDNWLSGRAGPIGAQLTPFPDSLQGVDWADSRSDFDVPHRVIAGVALAVPGPLGLSVGTFYRFRSGYPFTPGFREGVDANGDGSPRNDPAFIDEAVLGMPALLAKWDCLAGQRGRFAERNSCREPGVHALDLRIGVTPVRPGGHPIEFVIEALNLLESDLAVVDRALYLVDRGKALALDPATATVTVPLVANPDFGEPLVRRTTGRKWRLGLRVNW